jgi:hypothetical protein
MPKSTAVSALSPTALALAGVLKQASKAIQLAANNMPFLKMLKTGEWQFGADETEVEEGSLWAVDPDSFTMGFQAWGDAKHGNEGELQGEVIHLVTEPPVLRSDLEDVEGDWKALMGCTLVCIDGESEGTQVAYKVTSLGGIKAIGKLMAALVARIESNPKDGTYIPVVELANDYYKHKKYGRIYNPLFTIKEWTDEDELLSTAEEDDNEEDARIEAELAAAQEAEEKAEAAAKVKTRKVRAKKTVEPEEVEVVEGEVVEEEPTPIRRRRRRV